MRIFVAGASGAIGQPLIAELIRQGHTVTAMSRSAAGAQKLVDLRASVAVVNAFDQLVLEQALRRAQAEVVIDQLTALPKDPSQIATAFPGDRKLRLEGVSGAALSQREMEVLQRMAAGKSNKEIGAELFISDGTVKTHAKSIFTKLDVVSRTEAVATATRRRVTLQRGLTCR